MNLGLVDANFNDVATMMRVIPMSMIMILTHIVLRAAAGIRWQADGRQWYDASRGKIDLLSSLID